MDECELREYIFALLSIKVWYILYNAHFDVET